VLSKTMNTEALYHPDRKIRRIRPLKAWHHFQNLIANKEDTSQVFHIIEALNGSALINDLKRFLSTKAGQERFAERRNLPPYLDDHEMLKKLPAGSLGRSYVDFMEREGLTAQGLVDEYESFTTDVPDYEDAIQWYGNRLRDTHDLLHVLTTYGRDALGEACVLGFSYSQNKGPGVLFIAYMAAREVAKGMPKGAATLKAVREGQKLGKQAEKIAAQDILALLPQPIDSVREQLGIKRPKIYHAIHEICRDNGFDPYAALAAS